MATLTFDVIVCVSFFVTGCVVSTSVDDQSRIDGSSACLPIPHVFPAHHVVNITQVTALLVGKPWYSYQLYDSVANEIYGDHSAAPHPQNAVTVFHMMEGSGKHPANSETEILIQEDSYREDDACVNLVGLLQYTAEGHLVGPVFAFASPNGSAVTGAVWSFLDFEVEESVIWSTDMSTYVLLHSCRTRNLTTGNCSALGLTLFTNVKPTRLSDSQQQDIATAVYGFLSPYCLNSPNVQKFIWSDDLAECPRLDPKNYPEPLASAFLEDEAPVKSGSISTKTVEYMYLISTLVTFASIYV